MTITDEMWDEMMLEVWKKTRELFESKQPEKVMYDDHNT